MKKKILIVEDENIIAGDIDATIRKLGYESAGIVGTGEAAIEAVRESLPDIVLMDIVMPGIEDGISAAGKIHDEFSIPVVFLTAYADEEKLKRAKLVEPFGYIVKPFNEKELKAVIEMALYKHEMEISVKESYHYANSIVQTVREPLVVLDKDLKVRSVNKSFYDTFKVAPDDTLGNHIYSLGNGQWDIPDLRQLLEKILSENTPVEDYEVIHSFENIGKRVMLLNACRVEKVNGEDILILLAIEDITERKKKEQEIKGALREKELLLKEIHHRVKNNLQIISSLLSLQRRKVGDEKLANVLKESQNRVLSIAAVHDALYSSPDMNKIKFKEYIEGLVKELFNSYLVEKDKIELELNFSEEFIDINKAIPFALIINELVTNSIKHAFPDSAGGKISIALSTRNAETMELSVADDGKGMPDDLDFHKIDTLGLNLVMDLVKQIGATIRLDRGEGTKFIIEFKKG